jgi:two-component system, OmpR family, sensor histidine kinase KdpD
MDNRLMRGLFFMPYVAAVAAVAITTALISLVGRAQIANISMLYLVAVLVVALAYGRAAAIVTSILAFLTFDWFFVPPTHQFVVADAQEVFSLALFLIIAVVTGTLAARERARAQEAEHREHDAKVLYEAAFLMAEPDLERALVAVAEHFRAALDLDAVSIEADSELLPHPAVAARDDAARDSLRATGTELRLMDPSGASRRIRLVGPQKPGAAHDKRARVVPIVSAKERIGTLRVLPRRGVAELGRGDEGVLAIAAAQLGLTIESARLRKEATEAEVLRRADDLKTELLHAVSHELRTPLASILASAGSLRQRDVEWTDRERDEFAGAIQEEAVRLDRVVGNLLDLSRIENGTLVPHKAWHDVGALIEDVAGRMRPVTSGHPVRVDVPEDLPPVELDYVEIQQVLSNLVENAAKFSPPGTEIGISVARDNGDVRFVVRDHGPGIGSADTERIFEPFVRLARAGQGPRGVGLGLAIAKRLVEAHAGAIWIDRGVSEGTAIVFTLPGRAGVS